MVSVEDRLHRPGDSVTLGLQLFQPSPGQAFGVCHFSTPVRSDAADLAFSVTSSSEVTGSSLRGWALAAWTELEERAHNLKGGVQVDPGRRTRRRRADEVRPGPRHRRGRCRWAHHQRTATARRERGLKPGRQAARPKPTTEGGKGPSPDQPPPGSYARSYGGAQAAADRREEAAIDSSAR